MLARILIIFLLLFSNAYAEEIETLDKVVAVVNDDVVTETELNAQVKVLKKQIIAKNMDMPEDVVLRKQVLQHLINVKLQLQLAKNNSINVDDVELNNTIKKIAEKNKMSLSQLRKAIAEQGLSWKEYRSNIRKEMLISQIQQKAVAKDLVVSNQQVDDYLKKAKLAEKSQQKYHVKNIVIPLPEEPSTTHLKKARQKAEQLLAKIKKGEDFSKLAIEESSGEFALEGGDLGERHLAQLPEVFAKKIKNMKAGEVAGPIRTGNGYQLIKLVSIKGSENKRHLITKTHTRHILIKPNSSTTVDEAERRAANLYQQLKSGKNFAQLAKQYSSDITSAPKGGDLGWVKSGELVPEFEKAMGELPVNKISQPVKTQYGWHIIQVLARKKVDDSKAYQKQQIRQYLQQRKFAEAIQNWQQHVRADAYVKVLDKELA